MTIPGLRPADLPEPQPLRRVLGPGVIAAGVGLASGEFVIWPYISANVGLVFLWAAVVGVVAQYFLNMEIERYTLATGETALTGFSRLWRHWGLVFALLAVLANIWPGWATSSATVLTYAVGGGDITVIAVVELLVIGAALTLSPVIYRTVEATQFVKVGAVLVFLVIALFLAITGDAYRGLGEAVTHVGQVPAQLGAALVLGAMAFAGAGGGQNLVQSNWIRDKNMGMGARIPRLVSPVTGEDQAAPATGYSFEPDEANMARWRGWWRVANIEQLVSFVAITIFTIFLMSMLAYSTVFGADTASNVTFLRTEGEVLNQRLSWFGTFFWAIGALSLFAASMGICDYVARMVADNVKTVYLPGSARWTESRIYSLVVWFIVLFGIAMLTIGFDQPITLLVISASVGGIMMFLYSALLALLNRKLLPEPIRVRGYRLVIVLLTFAFFGYFSVLTLIDQFGKLF
ncbi:Nramp family divalent metal transporter [Planomonospora sp. ID67723]|uniref:Nramp family divalent metal transporter n=1 Tax=Planomonospora sp. ID67723 TaxID=2738134 RepID=UPI0018C407B9|nr:Nramp family divalent metal transporter [Planomonospora sp. ID67723]MBG0826520.1 Nramp family divalent metal transporter [Planomonospora sp. ID67723]